ncbi:MAG TPA: hypothetical protein VM938_01760 [Acidimicrobiales bacterium]|nr:hypothetical protein [Acidimicrobiales bacterium]
MRRPTATTVVTALVIGAASAFVFFQLRPDLLFSRSTPAGGDMGAHVWGPAYMRDHLLPNGRIFGWAPDWYAGMPYPTFYFPLPTLLIVLLDVVLPYGMAFKLVTVLGLVTLPIAACAFGRLAGLPSPAPACLGIATLPFLFDRSFTIYGGNIASTLAGEFSFSISLSVALVFLGLYARGLETGRQRAWAAGLLAITGLCHVVPVFLAISGAVVLTLMRLSVRRLLAFAVPVAAVAACLGAVWWLPFLMRIPYTNDMGWEKLTTYTETLFGARDDWLLVLALIGVIASIAFRRRAGIFLTLLAVFWGLAFRFMPQGRLWNGRVLPLWILALYLLAGLAVAEVGRALGRLWVETPDTADGLDAGELVDRRRRAEHVATLITPFVALFVTVVLVAAPLHPWWLPVNSATRSFIPDWVKWNYTGYEGKAAYPEYRDVVTTMDRVGRDVGCGRAMWEYESEQDRFGTPMALMLLPYWTNGCIGSVEGLFFESSATTPYHFLNQSELSVGASRPQRGLPYHDFDVDRGLDHLRLLGVRYYLAFSDEAKNAARANPGVRIVGTSAPWSVTYKTENKDRVWEAYEILGSEIVAPLQHEPVVMTGVAKGGEQWQHAAVEWYQDPARWDVPLAAGGPREWERVEGADRDPPRRPLPPVVVTNVEEHDQSIEFDVDRVGTPVLVKASYFPNWRASGARGVWRVTPNQMVVIPTERHVKLSYGYTPVDLTGWALTFLGIAGLFFLWRRGPVEYPARTEPERPVEEGAAPASDWGDADDAWERELATTMERGSEGD